MGHWLSDAVYKSASFCTVALSFVEQHVAVFTLLVAIIAAVVRAHYDKKEDIRREREHQVRLGKLRDR